VPSEEKPVVTERAPPLKWADTMATGIAEVDEQHRRLLDIFNRIVLAQTQDVSREAVTALLNELVEYTRYHFREEERLMRRWRVSATHRSLHLRAHGSFRRFLRQAQACVGEHLPEVIVELMAFLAQWLLHHIMQVDMQMGREIQARQSAGPVGAARRDPLHDSRDDIAQAVSDLTERLGQRTFTLLGQRQQLVNLQALYRALLHCGDVLIRSRREPEMLQSLCAKLVQDTLFHAAWIGRPGQSGVFDVLAHAGTATGQVPAAPPRLMDEERASVWVKAWRARQLVVCNDTLADPSLQPWHADCAAHQWLSVIAIPITRGGQMWAVLALASARRDCFDAPTIDLCSRIIALLGHGLDEFDLKKRIRSLRAKDARMARTDSLTGLPNRLALEEYLPQAIARARRRGSSLAVGMMDLDDFKCVNDRLGHETGDELLRCLSDGLLECLRDSDFIARMGGDEFVVVLEDLEATQLTSQLDAALKRLHRVLETPFMLGAAANEAVSIDMSMGVALYPNDGSEAELLLRQADAAMYQAKQNKRDRAQWWQIGTLAPPEQAAEGSFDPFGADAQELMRSLAPHLHAVAEKFTASLHGEMLARRDCASILACLSREEYQSLAGKQSAHLAFLLDALTTEQAVAETAQRLGMVHALIGISGAWMARAVGMYRDHLRNHLDGSLLTARTRYLTLRAADARLQLDLESQLQAMQSTLDAYQVLLARPMDTRVLSADWLQPELDALAALPGIRAALLWWPDAQNRMIIERAGGEKGAPLTEAFRVQDLYPLLDPRDVRGRGLVATTWRTDSAQETSVFAAETRARPWQALMRQFGIRSAATFPVHRHGTVHAVLMLFGAYPHQFASGSMQTWRLSVQNRWDLLTAMSHHRGDAIDTDQAAQIRSLLYGGGVEMFVQPVVNLADGALVKVEALARLRAPDGALLTPGRFLPALGETDLDSLFRQGLAQALGHLRRWHDENLDIGLAINLAPSTLVHPDCARWIEQALREAQVAPQHLTLELLESQALEVTAVDEAITRLASTGVRFALDDLGAGFSNLKRLADLPFDLIKIDQHIIQDLLYDPIKSLSLIRTVVQIGQDLERDVVVEGLEDAGIIEAAVHLGCRLGQGYGLGRPMPAAVLTEWLRTRAFRGELARGLQSWLGALAYEWMVMHDPLHLRNPGELATCPLTAFLETQAVRDSDVLEWHRQIHQELGASVRMQIKRNLLQWLAKKTRLRCRNR
jgi:diguanylate cyclase (GGDEF)-like protein/hemerythrin-like metal-binding protein